MQFWQQERPPPNKMKTPLTSKTLIWCFPSGSDTKESAWFPSLGQGNPLEKGMATYSSIFAWRIPWTEKRGGLQSMGSQRVRHDWMTNTFTSFLNTCLWKRNRLGSDKPPSFPYEIKLPHLLMKSNVLCALSVSTYNCLNVGLDHICPGNSPSSFPLLHQWYCSLLASFP